MRKKIPLAALAAVLCAPVPARAGSFLDAVFGVDHRAVAAKKTASARHHRSDAQRPRHDAGSVLASWYGGGERLSRHTSDGGIFRPGGLTAAHRSLPLGSRLRVCYDRCVIVRITDRGPARWTGRQLDLSRGAAAATGMISRGVARVTISRVGG